MLKSLFDNLNKKLLNYLPDTYNKDINSNIGKLINMFSEELHEINETRKQIYDGLDVDKSEGQFLNLIGGNIGQSRGNFDDEIFRMAIKSRVRQNFSPGDINSLIEYIATIMQIERSDISILPGYTDTFYQHLEKNESAAMLFQIPYFETMANMPYEIIESLTAAGVKTYWELIFSDLIKIQTEYSKNEIGWYIQPKANTFAANEISNQMSYIYPFFLKTQSEYKAKEEIWKLYLSNLKYESFFNYSDQRVTLSGEIKTNQNANQMSYIYPDGFKFETSYNLEEQVWSFYPSDMKIETKYLGSKQKLVKAKTIKAGQEVLYN